MIILNLWKNKECSFWWADIGLRLFVSNAQAEIQENQRTTDDLRGPKGRIHKILEYATGTEAHARCNGLFVTVAAMFTLRFATYWPKGPLKVWSMHSNGHMWHAEVEAIHMTKHHWFRSSKPPTRGTCNKYMSEDDRQTDRGVNARSAGVRCGATQL